jgi:predicted DNA-binding transcriptional regulator AlpA
MAQPIFLTATQVAARIGATSATAFLADRARLERDEAFPMPTPWSDLRAMRWRAAEIEAWLDRASAADGEAALIEKARTP